MRIIRKSEALARWLGKIDYSNISVEFRKTLMDYYMEVGMMEEAFFGIELYGCDIMGSAKILRLQHPLVRNIIREEEG